MHPRTAEARASLVNLLVGRGLIVAADSRLLARIEDPADAVDFDEIGLDSLALLTLAIDLDGILGIPVSVQDLEACGDLGRTAGEHHQGDEGREQPR